MTAIIEISSTNYGGGFVVYNWHLKVKKGKKQKTFYLGQDAKFCARVLGMRPADVAEAIGSNDLRKESVRRKLAYFIIQSLGIDEAAIFEVEPWALAAE